MANKYGISLDKAMLIISLLKASGIEAWPVLGNYDDYAIVTDVPSIVAFNDVWIVVNDGTSQIFIDPTGETCKYGYFPSVQQNRIGLLVKPDTSYLGSTINQPPDKNLSKLHLVLALDERGNALADGLYELNGYPDNLARRVLKDKQEREREIYFSSIVNILGQGAVVKSYATSDMQNLAENTWVKFSFYSPNLGVRQGRMMILKIPLLSFSFSLTSFFPSLTSRNFDYVLPANFRRIEHIDIKLPEGYRPVYLPKPDSQDADHMQWTIELKSSPGMVSFERSLTIKNRQVLASGYSDFKRLFEEFSHPRNLLVLLEKE